VETLKRALATADFRNLSSDRERARRLKKDYFAGKRKISAALGRSESVVRDWLKDGKVKYEHRGQPAILSTPLEISKFKDGIRQAAASGKPVTRYEACVLAAQIRSVRLNTEPEACTPSVEWFSKYVVIHGGDDIVPKAARPVEMDRAQAATKENMEAWHNKITAEVHPERVPISLQFNMDECMAQWKAPGRGKPFKVKVFAPRDIRVFRIVDNSDSMHVTIMICTCADGTNLTHTLILPRKDFPADFEAFLNDFNWAGSEAGWITLEIFDSWVTKIFVPALIKKRLACGLSATERAILWLDGHSSRMSAKAMEALKAAHCDAVLIPPKTSHICQPNDQGVNGALSQILKMEKRKCPELQILAPRELRVKLRGAWRRWRCTRTSETPHRSRRCPPSRRRRLVLDCSATFSPTMRHWRKCDSINWRRRRSRRRRAERKSSLSQSPDSH